VFAHCGVDLLGWVTPTKPADEIHEALTCKHWPLLCGWKSM